MTRKIVCIGFLGVALLSPATPVSARLTDWERLNTGEPYATLEECEKALTFHADAFEFLIKHRDPDAKRHGKAFVSHDSTSLYGHEFFCLADTVDPPGSKRK